MPMDIYVPNDVDIIHQTKVDFRKRTTPPIVHLVQYERSLPVVEVELFYNGYSYTCPNNAEVWVRWSKLDGTYVYKICQVSADRKKVYFDIDYQMSYLPGDLNPILELQIGTKMAGSSPIPISIDRNPIQDGDRESHVEDLQVEILREEVAEMQEDLDGHVNNNNNPHGVTKAQVGLGNADNTSDMNKPVSTAQQAEFLKAKYHLGAFDTVDTSNADYDLITRQTGYIDLGKLDWYGGMSYDWGRLYRSQIKNILITTNHGVYSDLRCADYGIERVNDANPNNEAYLNKLYQIEGITEIGICFAETSLSDAEVKAKVGGKLLQYKLDTPYTEKVIKNRPLNTLDQQGSEFVRKEWEKTQNLYDYGSVFSNYGGAVSTSGDNIILTAGGNGSDFWLNKKLKANTTYTLSFSNSTNIVNVRLYTDTSASGDLIGNWYSGETLITFTPSADCYLRIWVESSNVFNGSIMFNEGYHAYPYQPYNGAIVHEKDIENVAYKNIDNYFKTKQTIDGRDYGYDTPLRLISYSSVTCDIELDNNTGTPIGYLSAKSDGRLYGYRNGAYKKLAEVETDLDPINDLLAELKTIVYDNQYPAVAEIDLTYVTYYALPSQISGDKIIMSAGMDMTKVKGRSYVVNQYVPAFESRTATVNGVTITWNTDGTIHLQGTSTDEIYVDLVADFIQAIEGKKYLILLSPTVVGSNNTFAFACATDQSFNKYNDWYFTSPSTQSAKTGDITIRIWSGVTINVTVKPRFIDLTQWFGSNDAIPADLLADPSLFTKKYWKKSLPFDTGHIEDSKPVKVVSYGANLFDKNNVIVPSTTGVNTYLVNLKNGTYTISANQPFHSFEFYNVNTGDVIAVKYGVRTYDFTISNYNGEYPIGVCMRPNGSASSEYNVDLTPYNIMLNIGSTAMPFQPFSRKEYPIIPIDMGTVDLGSLDYTKIESGGGIWLFMAQVAGKAIGTRYNHAWCEGLTRWDNSAWLMPDKTAFSCEVENTSIYFKNTDFVDATSFKQFMRGKTLTYELATQTHHALRSAGSVQDDNEKVKIANIVLDNSDNDHRFTYKSSANTTHAYKCGEILCDPLSNQVYPNIMCDKFTPVKSNDGFAGAIGIMISGQGEVYISFGLDSNFDTLEKANTWLQSNNVSINYYLTSPTDQSPSFALPENIEIQKGGTIEIEYDDGYSTPCDFDFEVAVSKVLEE